MATLLTELGPIVIGSGEVVEGQSDGHREPQPNRLMNSHRDAFGNNDQWPIGNRQ